MDRKYCYSAGLKPRVSGIVGGWEKRIEEMGLVGGNGFSRRKWESDENGRARVMERKAKREFSSSFLSHSYLWFAFFLSWSLNSLLGSLKNLGSFILLFRSLRGGFGHASRGNFSELIYGSRKPRDSCYNASITTTTAL